MTCSWIIPPRMYSEQQENKRALYQKRQHIELQKLKFNCADEPDEPKYWLSLSRNISLRDFLQLQHRRCLHRSRNSAQVKMTIAWCTFCSRIEELLEAFMPSKKRIKITILYMYDIVILSDYPLYTYVFIDKVVLCRCYMAKLELFSTHWTWI